MPLTRFRARIGKGASSGSGVFGGMDGGMDQIAGNFNAFIQHVIQSGPDIVLEALEPTYKKSQDYCPVDTGSLKESGYLEVIGRGRNPTVAMGYGRGGYPSYAPVVHEDTTMRHAAPTRAKWLQGALEEDYNAIIRRLQENTRFVGGM